MIRDEFEETIESKQVQLKKAEADLQKALSNLVNESVESREGSVSKSKSSLSNVEDILSAWKKKVSVCLLVLDFA